MKIAITTIILIFGCINLITAQKTEEIRITGVKGVDYDECIPAAREKAINKAKIQALNDAGVSENIRSFTDLFRSESDDTYFELFTSQVFTDIRGSVTEVEIIDEKKEFTAGDNIKFEVSINCKVLKYNTLPDPMFSAEIKGIQAIAYENSLLEFTVKPTKDSWLHVFCVSDDEELAVLLHPSKTQPVYQLSGGKEYNFPRAPGHQWRLTLGGKEKIIGRVIIVLTKEPYHYNASVSYKNIVDWIFSIPPDMRTMETFPINIIREE
jgi:hypothetical protein